MVALFCSYLEGFYLMTFGLINFMRKSNLLHKPKQNNFIQLHIFQLSLTLTCIQWQLRDYSRFSQ